MKRILLIETLSQINGGQKVSLMVSDMLRNSGDYEVIWAIPEEGLLSQRLKENDFQYFLLGNLTLPSGVKAKSIAFKYGKMSLRAISKILKIVRKEKIDIIYAPGPVALPWSAICGKMCRKPVIWHLHHIFEDKATKKLINYCCGFESVKKIIAVSETVGKQIDNSENVEVLYNLVDFLKYSTGDKTKVQSEFPFCTGKSVIVHVALLEEEKRQKVTVQTIAELKKRGIEAYAAFVGTVKPGDNQYVNQIKLMAEKLEVSDQCCFLGYRTDVQDILAASDLAFIPSIEGFSLAGIEAAAAGIPVLACDNGGNREIVGKLECATLFSENDAFDAAEKISDYFINDKRYSNGETSLAVFFDAKRYETTLLRCFIVGEVYE